MGWLDRAILVFVGAGLWLWTGTILLDSNEAAAQRSVYDIVEAAVSEVESRCSVTGEVFIYGHPYGEIESGQLSC